jgi:drug/metabolite transporter (DMT)-like permease
MGQGHIAARVFQHKGGIAKANHDLAPLCIGRIAPQARTFQPLVFVQGRHGLWGKPVNTLQASLTDGGLVSNHRFWSGFVAHQGAILQTERTLPALGLILVYATVIGWADNFVRVIAAEAGLWQFHATRSALAIALLVVISQLTRRALWPRNLAAVAARSAIHGVAMLIYFGALAFLPVAIVAAGLFTAPIFVLLINRVIYGRPIGPVQALAVLVGFAGVVMVLGPTALQGASMAALLPVAAGALYAMGNIATREWCAGEAAETLLAGFFAALGVLGVIGLVVLMFMPLDAPAGTAGFVLRGWVMPSSTFLFWVAVQAVVSVIGVGMMIRAYQIASAARVAVFEYVILPASALWSWVIWGEALPFLAICGMALIAAAGAMIALVPAQSSIAARQ